MVFFLVHVFFACQTWSEGDFSSEGGGPADGGGSDGGFGDGGGGEWGEGMGEGDEGGGVVGTLKKLYSLFGGGGD